MLAYEPIHIYTHMYIWQQIGIYIYKRIIRIYTDIITSQHCKKLVYQWLEKFRNKFWTSGINDSICVCKFK